MKYRASRDGFDEQNFDTKFYEETNTLTIIKTTNGNIFGVFAEKAWTQSPVVDTKAFIISLINKENKPFKAMTTPVHPYQSSGLNYYALYSSNEMSFGHDSCQVTFDISISSNSNANQSSYFEFGYAFQHQDYPAGSAKAQAILAGSKNFQTIEIEVFTKKN